MSQESLDRVFCFDVESVGLHGEGFAVGWVVFLNGKEVSQGYAGCPPERAVSESDEDKEWVKENVIPHLPPPECKEPGEVREVFWEAFSSQPRGTIILTDCGWPVEANFLSACIQDDPARKGSYLLHDLATLMLPARMSPLQYYPRLPDELPAHNPVNDARQSARLFHEILPSLTWPQELQ